MTRSSIGSTACPPANTGSVASASDVLRQMWGPEVYGAMRAIKEALDPHGILNPGVLFSSAEWWESWGGLEARESL